MKNVRQYSKAAALVAVMAAGTTWYASSRAWAFNPQPDPPGISGLVGFVDGQTARLNTVNITNVPVHVTLNFFTMDGSVVKRTEGTLLPGHAAFLELTRRDVGDRTDSRRTEVYSSFVVDSADGRAFPPGPCRPTLEVYDADGRTTVLNTNFHNPPGYHNPPGD